MGDREAVAVAAAGRKPRRRRARFGGGMELVARRPGGGPAIWFGSVDALGGWSTPRGCGKTEGIADAKRRVEANAQGLRTKEPKP